MTTAMTRQTVPLAAVSTKAYFSVSRARCWVREVAALAPTITSLGVEVAVLPSFPMLVDTGRTLAGTGLTWGAQDVAPSAAGAQTGEVLADVLAELGCRYAEVGHAERRSLFGEDDRTVQAKTRAAVDAGLVPLLCVGEVDHGPAEHAASACVRQVHDALDRHPDAEVVVAYEPRWAIGADRPAPADHVRQVARALRATLAERPGPARVLYGGTAGPGLAAALGTEVDGLFLGRRAHDVAALAAVIQEVAAAHPDRPALVGAPPARPLTTPPEEKERR